MENLGKWTENTDTCITNRIQNMEERVSDFEDTIEEIDALVKKMTNLKKGMLTQNIQEILDTMKRWKKRMWVEKGE